MVSSGDRHQGMITNINLYLQNSGNTILIYFNEEQLYDHVVTSIYQTLESSCHDFDNFGNLLIVFKSIKRNLTFGSSAIKS